MMQQDNTDNEMVDSFDWDEFKCRLNTFMVMYAPENCTVGQIEMAMVELISVVMSESNNK